MVERGSRDELEGVQELGRLADEMIFALGRVVRSEDLEDEDRSVIERAKQLFEMMASPDVVVPDRIDAMMINPGSYLDALHVVETRAGHADVEAYAGHLAELLQRLVDQEQVSDNERAELGSLRELFAEVGEATLSRAGELSLPQDSPWPRMRQASSGF